MGNLNEITLDFVKELDKMFESCFYIELNQLLSTFSFELKKNSLINYSQIFGIFVSNNEIFCKQANKRSNKQGRVRFPELKILCDSKIYRFVFAEKQKTPFELKHKFLFMGSKNTGIKMEIIFNEFISRDKGFYFPQIEGKLESEIIRFNPKNLGKCPGNCVFCQRSYSLPTSLEVKSRKLWTPDQLLNEIKKVYGINVIKKIRHALVVTELFGDSKKYISFCQETKEKLTQAGFQGQFSAICQEIRSDEDIACMYEIVGGYDFCFTLECFQNRQNLMSKYKAIPMYEVKKILDLANQMNFKIVMVNYIAGLDDLSSFCEGIEYLDQHINAIGLNVYTPYTDKQLTLKNSEADKLEYYWKLIKKLEEHSIKIYAPELYERSPTLIKLMNTQIIPLK